MRAEKNGICREADPRARMPWFAEKMQRTIESGLAHQQGCNRADGESCRLAANTFRIIAQELLPLRARL